MSDTTDWALRLMRGEEQGWKARLARIGLWLLSIVYGVVIRLYWWMFRAGVLKRVHLRPVVISVGNITVGGTGKTTTVQYLVQMLNEAGYRSAVLSYGYRSANRESVQVVSDGKDLLMGASEAGDEAVLLAQTLPGTPVLIGRRRVLSGAEADRRFQPDVLICDDAFQYWRLHRDIDLLLLDAVHPWGYGYLLPRGLLREPRSHARRSDGVLITHADLADRHAVSDLKHSVQEMERPVWTCVHEPRDWRSLDGSQRDALEALAGKPVLAVSSLGDPESFEKTLARLGTIVTSGRFPDHHRYTEEDILVIQKRAEHDGLLIVTTAKDAVKIREWADPERWRVLEIGLRVDKDEASFRSWLLDNIRYRSRNA